MKGPRSRGALILRRRGCLLPDADDPTAAPTYAVVDVYEEAGETKLRVTARGNPLYAAGANDPADVVDLFSVEMP